MNLYDKIYNVVKQIPYGKVATYGQIGIMCGNPYYARVVGNALHNNPNPNEIPCYRVVNRNGALSNNFAFGGINAQAELLMSEGVEVVDGIVELKKYRWQPDFQKIKSEDNCCEDNRGTYMDNIKWLFFDIGSTLVDESECVKKRCDVIIQNNNIEKQGFYDMVAECAKTDSYAVRAAAVYYGAEIPRWYGELEKLYPDTKMILVTLSKKYKLGVIANQVAGTKERLDNWNIGKYFDVVVASAEAGCEKPDLKIFNLALEQAGCKPNEAVMIGDRLDNDIAPAKQLGMKTVWVRQGFAKYQSVKNIEEQPNYTIDSIAEVLDILT